MALFQMAQIRPYLPALFHKVRGCLGEQNFILPFRSLSHRYKVEHKVFDDLNKLWEKAVNEQCDSSSDVKIIDILPTRLGESLKFYEFLLPNISCIYMLS